jgi:hypothetical protein
MQFRNMAMGALAPAAGILILAQGASASVIFDATTGATAYIGYIATTDMTAAGTLYNHPSYPASHLIDGDLATRTDTYSGTEVSFLGSDTAPLDFLGVTWSSTVSDIVAVRLHQFIYFDGGWFGTPTGDTNAANVFPPGANNAAANAADVGAPTVQVTTDSGATWTSVSSTENYVSIVQPQVLADFVGRITTPITFEFAAQSGINGIRLVGYGGGRSDVFGGRDEQGWASAAELEVGRFVAAVPEPGTAALFSLGLAGLGVARRRKNGRQAPTR